MAKKLFFLASCPEDTLAEAIRMTKKYVGKYTAGDKDDLLNKDMLMKEHGAATAAWKNAWLGKTKQRLDDYQDDYPGEEVTAIAVAGGPGCDWERGQLYSVFAKNYPNMKLKQCGDTEDYEGWLNKNFPGGLAAPAPTAEAAKAAPAPPAVSAGTPEVVAAAASQQQPPPSAVDVDVTVWHTDMSAEQQDYAVQQIKVAISADLPNDSARAEMIRKAMGEKFANAFGETEMTYHVSISEQVGANAACLQYFQASYKDEQGQTTGGQAKWKYVSIWTPG